MGGTYKQAEFARAVDRNQSMVDWTPLTKTHRAIGDLAILVFANWLATALFAPAEPAPRMVVLDSTQARII